MNSREASPSPPRHPVPPAVGGDGANPAVAVSQADMQRTYREMIEAITVAEISKRKCDELIKDIESFKRTTFLGHAIFWMSGMLIGALLAKHGWIGL